MRAKMDAPDNPLRRRAKELGLTMVEREWIPSSRRAHECTEHARAKGRLLPFQAALLQAYWSEGADIHDWDVLEATAVAVDLDPAAMRAAVEAGVAKEAVDARIAVAHELGIHAVPTFIVADRVLVQGAQTVDVFERALERMGIEPTVRS